MCKLKMFGVIIIMAYVTHQLAAAESCNLPSEYHKDDRRSQDPRCCIPVTCNPGEGPNLCNSSGAEAFCTPCALGWYNTKTLRSAPPGGGSMELCQPFTPCREGFHFEKSAGNATHDRVCECKDGLHMGTFGECFDQCPPGKYWQKGKDLCILCPNGTFTNTSGREECSPCSLCGTTITKCNETHDAECSPGGIEAKPTAENNNGLKTWKIAIISVAVIGVAVLAIIVFLRWKYGSCWFSCTESSDPPTNNISNEVASVDPEIVALNENGISPEANHQPSSRRRSTEAPGCLGCLSRLFRFNRDSHHLEEEARADSPTISLIPEEHFDQTRSGHGTVQSTTENDTTPSGRGDSHHNDPPEDGTAATIATTEPSQAGSSSQVSVDRVQSGGSSGHPSADILQSGGSSGHPSADILLSGGSSGHPSADILQSGGSSGHPSADILLSVGSSGHPSADILQSGGSSGQSFAVRSQCGDSIDQPLADIPQPGATTTQPANSIAQSHTASGGDRASSQGQVDQVLHSGNGAMSCLLPLGSTSLCTYEQSMAGQSETEDNAQSFAPQTRHRQGSGSISLQETPNYNLQSDRPAVQNKKVERYDSAIQSNYNNIQKALLLDDYFIGSLHSSHVITEGELKRLRKLKKEYDGNAEALFVLRDALRRNGDKACDPFLKALLEPESRQDVIALLIDRERAEQLIRERDNPGEDAAADLIGRSKSVEDPGKESLTSIQAPDVVDLTVPKETKVKEIDDSGADPGSGGDWADPAMPAEKC